MPEVSGTVSYLHVEVGQAVEVLHPRAVREAVVPHLHELRRERRKLGKSAASLEAPRRELRHGVGPPRHVDIVEPAPPSRLPDHRRVLGLVEPPPVVRRAEAVHECALLQLDVGGETCERVETGTPGERIVRDRQLHRDPREVWEPADHPVPREAPPGNLLVCQPRHHVLEARDVVKPPLRRRLLGGRPYGMVLAVAAAKAPLSDRKQGGRETREGRQKVAFVVALVADVLKRGREAGKRRDGGLRETPVEHRLEPGRRPRHGDERRAALEARLAEHGDAAPRSAVRRS